MKTVRNIALAVAGALALTVAHAQEAKKPEEQAKPKQHRMEQMHGGMAQMHAGMNHGAMNHGAMKQGGMKHACPEEAKRTPGKPGDVLGEHDHS